MTFFDNPFNILEVSVTANRRKIASAYEEKCLYEDSNKCEEARTVLTNPQRRIQAEVFWFADCNEEEVEEIKEFVGVSERPLPSELPTVIFNKSFHTCFNVLVAAFSLRQYQSKEDLISDIRDISFNFENIDADELIEDINICRESAGFPTIESRSEIVTAIAQLRESADKIIADKVKNKFKNNYCEIADRLVTSCFDEAVAGDILSDYELFSNEKLETISNYILSRIEYSKLNFDNSSIGQTVDSILDQLKEWNIYNLPIRKRDSKIGNINEQAREIYHELRDFAVELHNEHDRTELSVQIVDAMIKIFADEKEYLTKLKEDKNTISELLDQQKIKLVNAKFEELVKCVKSISTYNSLLVRELTVNIVKLALELETLIEENVVDASERLNLMEQLAIVMRSAAVSMINDQKSADNALTLAERARRLAANSPELIAKIDEDIKILEHIRQIQSRPITSSNSSPYGTTNRSLSRPSANSNSGTYSSTGNKGSTNTQNRASAPVQTYKSESNNYKYHEVGKKSNAGTIIVSLCVIALFLFILCLSSNASGSTSSSRNTRTYNTPVPTARSTSTPKPTATVKPETKAASNATRPENGHLLYTKFGDAPSKVEIKNNTDYDVLIQYDSDKYGECVYLFYVRGNSTAKLDCPRGKYTIKYYTGNTWYGEDKKFGSTGQTGKLNNGKINEFVWGESLSFTIKDNLVKEASATETSNKNTSGLVGTSNTNNTNKTGTTGNNKTNQASGTNKTQTVKTSPNPVYQRNGFVKYPSGTCLAPLEIHASSNASCFVSVAKYGSTTECYSIFISKGSTVEVEVPLGKYELYYCTGDTWYGKDEYFGENTAFFKADDIFEFSENGQYYTGCELTLYAVANGNLDTDKISENSFPK